MKKFKFEKIITTLTIGIVVPSCIIMPKLMLSNNVNKISKEEYSSEFLQEYYDNVEKMLSSDDDSNNYFNEIIVNLDDKTATKDGEKVDLSQELHLNVAGDYNNLENELNGSVYECNYEDNNTLKITSPYQTERLIVTTDNLDDTHNATNVVKMPYESYLLQYNSIVDTKEAYEELSNDPDVQDVSPDTLMETSSDEELSTLATLDTHNSWGYNTMGFNYMESAITDYGKQQQVVVSVIDTGCNINHEILKDRVINPYNAVTGETDVIDTQGHGTHVSGIIADCTDSNIKIMPIKVMDSTGNMYKSSEITAITYASENGANVINISLGSKDYTDAERQAIADAKNKGIIVCAAAGNANSGVTEYPAGYDETISVAAIDQTLSKAYYSNYGAKIDFTAPGSAIYSAEYDNDTGYLYMSGTSMASPHIAAAVGMIKSVNNQYTFDQVYKILQTYSTDLGTAGKDIYYGWGYINFKSVDISECGSPNCHLLYCDGCTGKEAVNCSFCTLKNFAYTIDGTNIIMTKYIGNDTEYFLPATIKKDGIRYAVVSQISCLDRIGTSNYVQFINRETSIQLIKNTYEENIKVLNSNGIEVTDATTLIGTGMSFEIQGTNGTVSKTVSIKGDLDGNSKITVTDLSRLNQYIVGNISMENEYYNAGDVDKSGKVSITDLSRLNQYLVGTINSL